MERATFDRFADEYRAQLAQSLATSGETPEFFHEYKVAVVAKLAARLRVRVKRVLDFGAGVGNSLPYLRDQFGDAKILSADVSTRSLEIGADRFPGMAEFVRIEGDRIPLEDGSIDLAFSACVFHHIPHTEHARWLNEMHRVSRKGGLLCIFEHNPWNPITRRIVRECPFDEDAVLVRADALRRLAVESGWSACRVRYTLFLPHALRGLRMFEPMLGAVPLGAQYVLYALA